MFTEEKLEEIKHCLDLAPEVTSYDVVEDGYEIWVTLFPLANLATPHAVKALKLADTFFIDFESRKIALHFLDENDVPI